MLKTEQNEILTMKAIHRDKHFLYIHSMLSQVKYLQHCEINCDINNCLEFKATIIQKVKISDSSQVRAVTVPETIPIRVQLFNQQESFSTTVFS